MDASTGVASRQRELLGVAKLGLLKLRQDLQMYAADLYAETAVDHHDMVLPIVLAVNQVTNSDVPTSALNCLIEPPNDVLRCELVGISKAAITQLVQCLTPVPHSVDTKLLITTATHEFCFGRDSLLNEEPQSSGQNSEAVDMKSEVTYLNGIVEEGAAAPVDVEQPSAAIDTLLEPKLEAPDSEQELEEPVPMPTFRVAEPSHEPDPVVLKRKRRNLRLPSQRPNDPWTEADVLSTALSGGGGCADEPSYSCPICHCDLPRFSLASHISRVHVNLGYNAKPLKYPNIDASLRTPRSLPKNVRVRPRTPTPPAVESTGTVQNQSSPVSSQTVQSRRTCPHCNRIFTTYAFLSRHKCRLQRGKNKSSTTDTTCVPFVVCAYCECKVAASGMERHIRRSHPNHTSLTASPAEPMS